MTAQALFDEITAALSAAKVFFGHGAASAEEEALWLLAHVLQESPEGINARPQQELSASQVAQARALLQHRIAKRVPMSYLTGRAWFAGLELKADPRALVPRSPFAEVIQNRFQPWLGDSQPQRVLDLCTGGGCIAIAMAKAFPGAQVDAVDLSTDALALAAENRALHGLASRVSLIQSDLFSKITGPYDLIASNPPYVSQDEYRQLPDEYFCEPDTGLVSAGDGLQIPLTIMQQAANYLSPKGLLFLEVGHSDEGLQAALPRVPLTWLFFENGGEGVCVFSREELLNYRHHFEQALDALKTSTSKAPEV